jgi:two-component system LytT family response regulator
MLEKANVVIIEDNQYALEHLKSLLIENFKQISISGMCSSVEEGVSVIKSKKPDLIFLDVELIDGTGFDVLQKTQHLNYDVIFTTAHTNYIQKAIEHYAFYYLLKALKLDTLREVLNRYRKINSRPKDDKIANLKKFLNEQESILMIYVGNEFISISIENIITCKAEGNYTFFILSDDSKLLASKSLKYYEDLLTYKGFFRANRFNLINIKHIVKVKYKEEILLSKKHHVTVYTRNKPKLIEILQELA